MWWLTSKTAKMEATRPLMCQRFIVMKETIQKQLNHLLDLLAHDSAIWANLQFNSVPHGIWLGQHNKSYRIQGSQFH